MARFRISAVVGCLMMLQGSVALALDVTGTVQLQGQVVFPVAIPGITATDLTVSVKSSIEATGNGVKCTILSTTSDSPDGLGAYPDLGTVSVQIFMERGGMDPPDGNCVITVQAQGTDGVSVSARGSQTLLLNATQIGGNAIVNVPDIEVRESKAIASLTKECRVWSKKQLKKRAKCNFLLLKKGPTAASRCTDAGLEPAACDPGGFVEAILAFAHDGNDQQVDPLTAEAVDYDLLKAQVLCQKRFGKAAANYVGKRLKRLSTQCIDTGLDSADCRDDQSRESKKKLDQIDKCTGDQMTDIGSGLIVPDVESPCAACIDGLGALDRKCLKACFRLVLDEYSDGIVGDVPVCGNGILQSGEACDDGNNVSGDCCSAICGIETEGPMGDPTCTDALDNDCDGNTDAADTDCQ